MLLTKTDTKNTSPIEEIMLNYGGLLKVLDEYREMLQFFQKNCPKIEADLQKAPWILRIIEEHDEMLRQIMPLVSVDALNRSRTGVVRELPFCDVGWERFPGCKIMPTQPKANA